MENSQNRFLSDILTKISSLKSELEALEEQVSQYQAGLAMQQEEVTAQSQAGLRKEEEAVAIEEDLPANIAGAEEEFLADVEPVVAEQDVFGGVVASDGTSLEEDLPEAEPQIESETAAAETASKPSQAAPVAETLEREASADIKVEIDSDMEILPLGEAIGKRSGAIMDKMTSHERWRTDIPGAPVSDIRSAISLNDRILFINTLFGEDPTAFKETLTSLNAAQSFEEGVRLLQSRHPSWNTDSDTVYRFMMAVRRKLK